MSLAGDYTFSFTKGKVTGLTIGGVAITDYTQNGTTITIPNATVKALSLGEQTAIIKTASANYTTTVTVATLIISDKTELNKFNSVTSGYYLMDANVTYDGTWISKVGYFWNGTSFSGTFDGRGHSISGMTMKTEAWGQSSGGFIGAMSATGVLKNVAFINCGVRDMSSNGGSPILCVGENNGTIENVYVQTDISKLPTNTNILARNEQGTVKNCFVYITGTDENKTLEMVRAKHTASNVYAIGQIEKKNDNEVVYADVNAWKTANADGTLTENYDTTIWDLSGDYPKFYDKSANQQ